MAISRRQFVLQSAAVYTALASIKVNALAKAVEETGIKDLYKHDFHIGTAISGSNMRASDSSFLGLVSREFSAITMENSMKWERIHPTPERWDWETADKFVDFGEKHNMYMLGHVLVWHSQVPDWVFQDEKGKLISREALLKRMGSHIGNLAGRYAGRMTAWDVVNEAIDEDKGWRKSPWFNTIGADFMDHAFNFAHDADPKAHLVYNDYNMQNPAKRAFLVDYIRKAKKRGVPIQGVGLQGHVGLDFPNIQEFEDSIEAYAAEGMRIHITEFDMDVLPVAWEFMGAEISTNFEYSDELNPYADGLPAAVEQRLNDRYVEFFKLFLKHRDKIERVTLWGTGDGESWKNNFPVVGRTNYPLLFDREYKRKPCYDAIAALKK
ncbi:endo-1,4-beta-xylanase [Teredinibacter haidensis]|uniref:endo-1,4-beta-xylanase n=1 Tax=Teredinibacter haidensis TaxID=2731755 RepID=UPI000948E3E4|nr:endo-1,4-beta-xylanase [Teredinibacter haidensis]